MVNCLVKVYFVCGPINCVSSQMLSNTRAYIAAALIMLPLNFKLLHAARSLLMYIYVMPVADWARWPFFLFCSVMNAVRLLLQRCSDAIQLVQQYEGCGALIRQSMSAPEDTELQSAATKALLPNIKKIKTFFDLARDVEQLTPALLRRLAGLGSIVEAPLLACMLTELLQAVLEWDQLKMMRPQIQNDFATYRRYFSRLKREQEAGLLSELPVADTDANAISMFIAENVPMMVMLSKVTAKTAEEVPRVQNTIAIVANMCCGMVHRRAYTSDATSRKLLMAMTSAAVLYDRITDSGVFVRRSHIGVSKCIKVLNKHGGATGEQLRATLRYSTMHYNSDTTPKNIRDALAR
ncbi:unnamed protein product [Ectocarpus sp. 12 AP-2014]